jgi:chorismate synthase
MPGNTFGNIFRLTTFGESHGAVIGGVIDGCPAGLTIDHDFIRQELDRRKPVYPGSTGRKEADRVEFISGLTDGITIGAPLAFHVKNKSFQSSDYQSLTDIYRPSHADFTYEKKYGLPIGPGGSRASGRETAARVVAGAVAKLFLMQAGIEVNAFVSQVGEIILETDPVLADYGYASGSPYGCPDTDSATRIGALIQEVTEAGDSIGGSITCRIHGTPAGLGEPVFDKLQASLAKAMLSVGTAKAFEYGLGFKASSIRGSDYNDQMTARDGRIIYLTNHDGGIQGGISNGEDIIFRVGFKPVPSVQKVQSTVTRKGEPIELEVTGRHDSCHVPRLVVVVESMAALVLADNLLMHKGSRI